LVHVKKVEIFGFKSFGFKNTTVQFEPGLISISGPNGSGKSTLSSVIAGKEEYEVTKGEILLNNEDLDDLAPEVRAHKGIFMSFQYPIEIPGVTVTNFVKTAINETRKAKGLKELK